MSGPIAITGRVIGADIVQARFVSAPGRVMERLGQVVPALGIKLLNNVRYTWLAGRALNKRTGELQRRINMRVTETSHSVTASVGTNYKIGIYWTRGIRAHDIYPKTAKALFWPGAAHPVMHVHIPAQKPRPFLQPALAEMHTEITTEIGRAVLRAV